MCFPFKLVHLSTTLKSQATPISTSCILITVQITCGYDLCSTSMCNMHAPPHTPHTTQTPHTHTIPHTLTTHTHTTHTQTHTTHTQHHIHTHARTNMDKHTTKLMDSPTTYWGPAWIPMLIPGQDTDSKTTDPSGFSFTLKSALMLSSPWSKTQDKITQDQQVY